MPTQAPERSASSLRRDTFAFVLVTDILDMLALGVTVPVLALLQAGNFEQALAIANGTPYGLTGGVYSRGPRHIEQAKREFRVRNLYINRAIAGSIVEQHPFGGPDYLLQFLELRTIMENTLRQRFAPPVGS